MEAISEYLLMFSGDVSPNKMRGAGMVVGDLSLATDFIYQKQSYDIITKNNLVPTMISPSYALSNAGSAVVLNDTKRQIGTKDQ